MLDRNGHQRLDQPVEQELTCHRLRHADHGREVKVFERRFDGRQMSLGNRWCDFGMAQVEQGDLCQRAPAAVVVARLATIALGYPVEAATGEEVGGELGTESRLLDEPLIQSRADGLLIEAHSLQVPPFQALTSSAATRSSLWA